MSDCFIAIDAGTTTSRAWLVNERAILVSKSVPVGVRDTARDGLASRFHSALRDLITAVRGQSSVQPTRIAAAGMITSSLGLKELPHQAAPAGLPEIAAGGIELSLPEISDLPIILFPGVRSGSWFADEDIESTDLMRGEETLCLGLASLRPGQQLTVLNLGSHWKAIHVNARGQITGSWTTLSGEMLHAVMTQTILASAVPSGRPEALDESWCQRGAEMFHRHGLSRTLFAVRLWEVQAAARVTARQRVSFLVGAVVAEGLDLFHRAGYLASGPVLLIGSGGVADAWQSQLEGRATLTERVDADATANAFVTGIGRLIIERTGSDAPLTASPNPSHRSP